MKLLFLFSNIFLGSATGQNRIESVSDSIGVFERLKLMDFERRVANK